mmetsp:Transcript_31810/g.71599  ORF Transcript_31810/g.71599 Transcript_31810/m.71599 type:complete len:339 (+) Transcript_31810:188-1204(+)|eukprot:CAMPEP_0172644472 /NCGR_PEP_ID=MMETSP1068-20121228/239228_1 /TAXON_ID=35684 /ORGANISM="Pseudopedinella elastica, Strain CCMP716" /LENGTH=338 /DNA_ID=CAMNT_0013458671 /DNA_START=143 /DNA_END=1159 /DNA_ORIENTATION=+
MIIYNNKSTADILFRMRGSAFDGNIKLWVAVIVNVLESIFFIMYGVMEIEGKSYLDILGKVLVFLLVFRSKLAYDRFWTGRTAIADMGGSMVQMVTDFSVFFEKDDEEQVAHRQELYRLAVATFVAMNVHIRKEPGEMAQIHRLNDYKKGGDSWMPERDKRCLEAMVKAGLLTPEEKDAMVGGGMSYVTICSTFFAQKLKDGFQKKMLHRNLMLDVDAQMKAMVGSWSACLKIGHYPFPFPYVQALSVFNLIFVASLPIALVQTMGVYTPVAVAMITCGFFGLDAVGAQLEDPFGTDANDLDVGDIAQDIADAAYVCLRARDGNAVKQFDVTDVIDLQ